MHEIFDDNKTEAILLVDAKVLLYNTEYLCPELATFIINCYVIPTRLFIIGSKEIKSRLVTTQGDPASMATYALG